MEFVLEPIGIVHSPYLSREHAPRQGRSSDTLSDIVIDKKYLPGLRDIGYHPHLVVLTWLDRADRTVLLATPPGQGSEYGVFATRSPDRPNPIGICVVDVIEIKGGRIRVHGLDAVDGTPVLDIKPYIAEIDCVKAGK